MTYERVGNRPNLYEFENGTRDEEENKEDMNRTVYSTRVVSMLTYIFSKFFDYIRDYQYNEDNVMEKEAFKFLSQLKRTHYKRKQLNEDVLEEFDELIEKMRRDLSGVLGNLYRTGEYDISEEYFEELLKEYQSKYSSLRIHLLV